MNKLRNRAIHKDLDKDMTAMFEKEQQIFGPYTSRLVIRKYKVHQENVLIHIHYLKEDILDMLKRNNTANIFTELYNMAYEITLCEYGAQLYDGLKQVVQFYLETIVLDKILTSSKNILYVLNLEWIEFQASLERISDVLTPLDNKINFNKLVYVKDNNILSVTKLCLNLFRNKVIYNGCVGQRLKQTLMQESDNTIELQNCCKMFMSLAVYDIIPEDRMEKILKPCTMIPGL